MFCFHVCMFCLTQKPIPPIPLQACIPSAFFFAFRNVSKSTPKQLGATRKFEGFAQSLWFQRKSAKTVHVGKKISRVGNNTFSLGFVCLVIFVLSLPWQITIEPPFGAFFPTTLSKSKWLLTIHHVFFFEWNKKRRQHTKNIMFI